MWSRSETAGTLRRAILAALLVLPAPVTAAPADDLKEAQHLYSQGKLPAALEKVDAFLVAQPKDAQGRFLRGLVLADEKRTAEALQVFTLLTEDYRSEERRVGKECRL